jgi:hypothetical protein
LPVAALKTDVKRIGLRDSPDWAPQSVLDVTCDK